ncbi:hypothetical protein MLD52_19790 [Puniceicoccaceae bacterium K14]|nr:hypothetical protein [Puniceicoccaceae bacterium K14]
MRCLVLVWIVVAMIPLLNANYSSKRAHEATWSFIQERGGIKIKEARLKEGKLSLPVVFDISGLTRVTKTPDKNDPGTKVWKVLALSEEKGIVLKLIYMKGFSTGIVHDCTLADLGVGTYDVFYGTSLVPAQKLGKIKIEDPDAHLIESTENRSSSDIGVPQIK